MLIHQDPTRGYLRDILDQPRALQATLDVLRLSAGLGEILLRMAHGEFRRIVLTGMGSSFHALYPLFFRLTRSSVTPVLLETSELVHYGQALLEPGTLVVAVSQSGRSVEILRLLEQTAKRVPVIGVTNTSDSPLALHSDQAVLTKAGAEHTVSCKTYQSALMALAWLGDALCGSDVEACLNNLGTPSDAVGRYLERWENHVLDLMVLLKGVHCLFLAGRGASMAAAGTGGLIIKESAHVHAEGMSSAAFRHGPLEMVSAGTLVLVFAGEAKTRELNRRLADEVRRAGGVSALVVESQDPGPFCLPAAPDAVRPILEILPVEMATLALAELQGRTAGAFERASKVTTTE